MNKKLDEYVAHSTRKKPEEISEKEDRKIEWERPDLSQIFGDVENFTSVDFYDDPCSRVNTQAGILNDRARISTFQRFIMGNQRFFKNKVVMDVGCGSGILCLFAAAAGAAHVIGIDDTQFVDYTRTVVRENRMDLIIDIVQGKVEELTFLPRGVKKVDVIIFSWMGRCLFHRSKIGQVLKARDKWLHAEGKIFPDKATLYIIGLEDTQGKNDFVNYWDFVYGFKMKPLRDDALASPFLDAVHPNKVKTNSAVLNSFNLRTMKFEEIFEKNIFDLMVTQNDYIHALATYFTVEFSGARGDKMILSTAPEAPTTGWKQTVFYLDKFITCAHGESIMGEFQMLPNPRDHERPLFSVKVFFEGEFDKLEESRIYSLFR